jgi:hypothetical protein
MKINDLKRNLKELTKEDLIKDIVDLFKKSEFAKDYYISKYSTDNNSLPLLNKYKEIIQNEFLPERGDGKGRLSVAKKAITEFKKISQDKTLIAELMIYYVEVGVDYTNTFGDINESFYTSMEGMYEKAIKFIVDNKLVHLFKDRCIKIVHETDGIGWGFHDELKSICCTYLPEC